MVICKVLAFVLRSVAKCFQCMHWAHGPVWIAPSLECLNWASFGSLTNREAPVGSLSGPEKRTSRYWIRPMSDRGLHIVAMQSMSMVFIWNWREVRLSLLLKFSRRYRIRICMSHVSNWCFFGSLTDVFLFALKNALSDW